MAMTASLQPRPPASRRHGPDSIVKNTAASFVAQLTTTVLSALLTVFLVRSLGARHYGVFALTVGMGAITLALADLGLTNSTARFVAEHRAHEQDLLGLILDALKLKVMVTGLLCAAMAASASVIADVYGTSGLVWPLRAIALATFGQSTFLMLLGVWTALGRTAVNVRLVAMESLLEITASVGLVVAGAGATGAAAGRAVGYVTGAVIAIASVLRLATRRSRTLWSRPRSETVRRVGSYARSVFAIDASYTLSSSLSVLLLGAYAGSAASGMFQAPARLVTLIQNVGLSTANGVAPRLARGRDQEPNVEALHGALRGLIDFQCFMLAPAIVWAKPLTHLLLGAGYADSAGVLAALAPYIFFAGLAPLVTNGVNYLGEAQRRVPISIATLILVAAAGVVLIPRGGAAGAAIATDIAFGFYTLAHIWLCRRLFKLRIGMLLWSVACGVTAAGAMGIVLASVGTASLTLTGWVKGGVGGTGAYIAMLIFTREIRGSHIAHASRVVRRAVAAAASATNHAARDLLDGLSGLSLRPIGTPRLGMQIVSPRALASGLPSGRTAVSTSQRRRRQDDRTSRVPAPLRGPSRLALASHPPAWMEDALSGGRRARSGALTALDRGRPTRSRPSLPKLQPRRAPRMALPDVGPAAPSARVHEIAWRSDDAEGAFVLCPLGRYDELERSESIPWGWRIPPSPTAQMRRAHAALMDALITAGWHRAGTGARWYAQRFTPPSRQPRMCMENDAQNGSRD